MSTTDWPVLTTAHDLLRSVVAALSTADLARSTPCSEWNVAQVLQHAAGDQLAYASALTGGPGPSFDPFAPAEHWDGNPAALISDALAAAADAWANVPADAGKVATPIPPGSLDPYAGSTACAMDAAVHAWDIAMATGQPSPLTDEMSAALLPVARLLVEPLRSYGAFAAALPAEVGDSSTQTLLRYLGRDPRWHS